MEGRLKERLGIEPNEYEYIDLSAAYFQKEKGAFGNVERQPTPFIIQKELIGQRRYKRFHYDFVYVLRLKSDRASFKADGYEPVQFVDLDQMEQLRSQDETFSDVVDIYARIVTLLEEAPQLLARTRY